MVRLSPINITSTTSKKLGPYAAETITLPT
jgi:hypothetical protein